MGSDDCHPVAFLPSGKPAPAVLLPEEVAELLRLDGAHPDRTLKFWRDTGQLRGIRLGRRLRYRLEDVERFLAAKAGNANGNGGLASRHSSGEKQRFLGHK